MKIPNIKSETLNQFVQSAGMASDDDYKTLVKRKYFS